MSNNPRFMVGDKIDLCKYIITSNNVMAVNYIKSCTVKDITDTNIFIDGEDVMSFNLAGFAITDTRGAYVLLHRGASIQIDEKLPLRMTPISVVDIKKGQLVLYKKDEQWAVGFVKYVTHRNNVCVNQYVDYPSPEIIAYEVFDYETYKHLIGQLKKED